MADEFIQGKSNTPANTSALNEKYQSFVANNSDDINTMYDASKTSNLAGLESAYNTNLSNMEAQKSQIDKQYNTAANDLAVQYERNRMNNNLQAQMNGLNVGTGSQMNLALGSQYNRDFGNLRGAQAAAQVEQDRQINNVKAEYQLAVQKAIADNDLARAAALVDEANNQVSQLQQAYQLQQSDLGTAASLLAAGGDYSGYGNMYGLSDEQMDALHMQWAVANPEAAVYSGVITPEQYKQITGRTARNLPGTGGGGGSAGSQYVDNGSAYKNFQKNTWYGQQAAKWDANKNGLTLKQYLGSKAAHG